MRTSTFLRFGARAVIALAAAAMLLASVAPAGPGRDGGAVLAALWAAFMVRTFWFHIGLALLPVVAFARWSGSRRWALAGGLLLGWTLLPAAWSWRPRAGPSTDGPTLCVMSMNLLVSNRDIAAVLGRIAEHDPDIVLFQEYTPETDRVLSAALAERYPHRIDAGRDDAFGQAIYSKLPFVGPPVLYPQGREASGGGPAGFVGSGDPQIRAVVDLDGREVVIQNVHFSPPVGAEYFRDQTRMLGWLGAWAGAEVRPLIVGGDLNATPECARVRAVLRGGLRDAHAEAGRGRGATWPDRSLLRHAPGVRIDHLLFRGVECIGSGVGRSTGSDHLPIIAKFRFGR